MGNAAGNGSPRVGALVRDTRRGLVAVVMEQKVDRLAENATTLSEPYSRHLGGKLRELRFDLGSNAQRITYWIAPGRRIVLLTVFRKTKAREAAERSSVPEQPKRHARPAMSRPLNTMSTAATSRRNCDESRRVEDTPPP